MIAHPIITALLVFAPCASQAEAHAQQVSREKTFVYSYQSPRLAKEMSLVEAGVPAELERILDYFQITLKFEGEIYFCEDKEAFSSKLQFEPPSWYNAVAQPGLKQIVVFVKPEQSPSQIAKLLNHELVHWALFQLPAQARRQIPLWLHEGLAEMWSDRGLAETYQVSLAWESKNNSLPRLSSFAMEFGEEPYRASVGYALAKEFVVHLVGHYDDELFLRIFNSMEAGRSFDQALVDHTGLSVVSHEKIVRANLNSWWRVVQEMYPHFFLLLVLIILGLVPFVALRRRHHREALHAVWQREEDEVEMLAGHNDNIGDE
ncbi:MAG: peptidase MA family metallohydrolase [Planctomycetota bacterium]|nr:peptidase MA family metallohydrolase [Planctomycetota bacterium]